MRAEQIASTIQTENIPCFIEEIDLFSSEMKSMLSKTPERSQAMETAKLFLKYNMV